MHRSLAPHPFLTCMSGHVTISVTSLQASISRLHTRPPTFSHNLPLPPKEGSPGSPPQRTAMNPKLPSSGGPHKVQPVQPEFHISRFLPVSRALPGGLKVSRIGFQASGSGNPEDVGDLHALSKTKRSCKDFFLLRLWDSGKVFLPHC